MATNNGSLHSEILNYDFRSGAKGSVLVMIIYNRDLNKTGSERRVRSPSAIFSRPFDFSRCAERDEKWSCGRLRQRGKRRHPYHPRWRVLIWNERRTQAARRGTARQPSGAEPPPGPYRQRYTFFSISLISLSVSRLTKGVATCKKIDNIATNLFANFLILTNRLTQGLLYVQGE